MSLKKLDHEVKRTFQIRAPNEQHAVRNTRNCDYRIDLANLVAILYLKLCWTRLVDICREQSLHDGGCYHVIKSSHLFWKSMHWFLYDNDLRHERVKLLREIRIYANNLFWLILSRTKNLKFTHWISEQPKWKANYKWSPLINLSRSYRKVVLSEFYESFWKIFLHVPMQNSEKHL